MMDLPLMMAAPPSTGGGGITPPSPRSGEPAAFEATLMTLLGDAGKEVVEMVEALELLADLEQDHEELTASGWPLPALLALRTQQEVAEHYEADADADLNAILDEVAAMDLRDELTAPALDELGELSGTLLPIDTELEGDAEVDGDADGVVPGDAEVPVDADADVAPAMPAGAQTAAVAEQADGEATEVFGRETRARGVATSGEESRAADTATRASDASRSGSRSDAPIDRVPTANASVDQPVNSDAAKQAATRAPVLSSAVLRVMEAVERLETLPPPRQLTIDLGDVRVRVGMEDGQVRLTLLEGDGESADELLKDARDELAQRGFDLGGDRDERPGSEARSEDERMSEPTTHRRSSPRPNAGLRL